MTRNSLQRTPFPRKLHMRSGAIARSRMRGIGLIEVLISVLVLGIGLLGIAAMQSLALRGGQSSLESSQAVIQTASIIEAMRANPAGNYNRGTLQCTPPTGATLAENDLRTWIQSLKNTIGTGANTCGQVSGCPLDCVITVQWDDTRAGGGATRRIVTRTRI